MRGIGRLLAVLTAGMVASMVVAAIAAVVREAPSRADR